MGNLQIPENFNMKDLYLDVRLRTCIFNGDTGREHDFTGRATFDTTFYRDNIGFGITDISIEVNPSLQPVIDVTFKDLYGNTLFGTQRGKNNGIDSSVLFNWPPPKFVFSFKGYLGRKVTWLLNLKTTNVSFVSSDGSYEIKCTFVPNQWGFMADLPVLYLLACKKLRYKAYGNKDYERVSDNCIFETDGVFSYVRVGKRVETKTKEETKDFDLILKQMGSIKYGLSSAVCGSRIINLNQPINGIVNNVEIQGFTPLMVTSPSRTIEQLIEDSKSTANIRKIDTYLQANIKRGDIGSSSSERCDTGIYSSVSYDEVGTNGEISKIDAAKQNEEKGKLLSIVDDNIKAIDNEIKRRVFSSTKSQISKLTIGEVFRQIARDSGFILGSILQAGFKGYEDNEGNRNSSQGKKELIGKCFPLFINDKGEEVPAMTPNDTKKSGNGPSMDYGVEKYEMAFVDEFISAIGEGITDNLVSDDVASGGEDIIQYRINNLEGIRPNPYRPFYSNIAENILIRSGIIAFITRSSDPALPGDYPYDNKTDRDKDPGAIVSLANLDMENLTKDILGQLSFEDTESLKRFCVFFDRFISDDNNSLDTKIGVNMLTETGAKGPEFDGVLSTVSFSEVTPLIMDARVNIGAQDSKRKVFWFKTDEDKKDEKEQESSYLTLRELIKELIPTTKASVNNSSTTSATPHAELDTGKFYEPKDDVQAFYNASFIDPLKLTATMVYNNGLYWCLPKPNKDKYVFVLFDNPQDAAKAKEINVQDATTYDDLEGNGTFDKREMDPIGYIPIEQLYSTVHEGEISQAINVINSRIKDDEINAVNYTAFKSLHNNPYFGGVDTNSYLQTRKVQEKDDDITGIPAKNLCVAVYTHIPSEEYASVESTPLVFGPFIGKTAEKDFRARNQRIAIKTMCKAVLKKMDEIQTEKNELIASIFGKASEAREAIYKQMHTIFHQWQIMASTVAGKNMCDGFRTGDVNEDLGKVLEREFGMCEHHKERITQDGTILPLEQMKPSDSNTLFVYDYPLAPVNKQVVNVKKSIINIQPLYKPDGSTTVLNIIQQICTKNNFVFVPFPGDANSDNIDAIYKPHYGSDDKIMNYFHVIYTPTPETRTKLSNEDNEFLSDYMSSNDFHNSAISIAFGAVDNQIIKSVNVGTDSTKPTAESILNLQRLVDKENSDHNVAMDCSMLPVYEGRSYKAKVDMLGNAQVYPMQYFYLQRMPMFGGLYQIMKVNHSITPNDMSTSVEGIRMRFDVSTRSYGGIPPVTLDELEALAGISSPMQVTVKTSEGKKDPSPQVNSSGGGGGNNYLAPSSEPYFERSIEYPGGLNITTKYKDTKGELYYPQETVKKYIVVHHTAGSDSAVNTIGWWRTRLKDPKTYGNYKNATQFIINKSGQIYEVYDCKYWAHNSSWNYNKNTIAIELTGYGYLEKKGDKYWSTAAKNWVNPSNVYDIGQTFQGSTRYFDAYTIPQIISTLKLVMYLGEKFDIPLNRNIQLTDFERAREANTYAGTLGLFFHGNTTQKTDMYPDKRFINAYNQLQAYKKNNNVEWDIIKVINNYDFNGLF